MTRDLLLASILFISVQLTFAQIPVEDYRKEISSLSSVEDFQNYWKKLNEIDQNVLLKTEDQAKYDSLSIDNMIKTALMVETHGPEALNPNAFVHILNLSHNYFGCSNLAFWPIIKLSKEIDNPTTAQFYPAYVLESIGLTFYGYSFLRKEEKYPRALEILNNLYKKENVIEELLKAFQKIKKYRYLKDKKIVGEWHQKFFKDREEVDTFQFILKEDDNLYFERYNSLNKLILQTENEFYKIFKVENEPFNWTFKLENSGNLKLLDQNKSILIEYRKVTK